MTVQDTSPRQELPADQPAGTPQNLPRPQREWRLWIIWGYLLRWYRSRNRHRGLSWWMLSPWGIAVLLTVVLIFVLNWIFNGLRIAYDICLLITSPAAPEVASHFWAVPLSFIGWLIAPGLAGVVAAEVVSKAKPADGLGGSALIPRLDKMLEPGNGQRIPDNFVEGFVRLHDRDWRIAQTHWERVVSEFLPAIEVDISMPKDQVTKEAVSVAASVLDGLRSDDICPKCPQPSREADGRVDE